jgi:tRNA threonylcarbamoyladenosine biosynthesis protein TsaB
MAMIVLAVDTSGPVCGVALAKDGQIVYEGIAVNKHTHSASLLPMIDEALRRSSLAVKDVDLFAAVVGPGSFTGVRIGVTTVKGMAHGAGKPCVGVNALEALAAGIADPGALICPIQDARAGQVYGAAFAGGMPPERVLDDMAAKLETYLDQVLGCAKDDQALLFVGDGVLSYRDEITARLGRRAAFPPAHLSYLRPSSAALLAQLETPVDYLTLMPYYLRAPQAERARKAKV